MSALHFFTWMLCAIKLITLECTSPKLHLVYFGSAKGCCTLARDRYKSFEKRGILVPEAKRHRYVQLLLHALLYCCCCSALKPYSLIKGLGERVLLYDFKHTMTMISKRPCKYTLLSMCYYC